MASLRGSTKITSLNQFIYDATNLITEEVLTAFKILVKDLRGFRAAQLENINTPLKFLYQLRYTGLIPNNNITIIQVLALRTDNIELYNNILELVHGQDHFDYIGQPAFVVDHGRRITKIPLLGKCATGDLELVRNAAYHWLCSPQGIDIQRTDTDGTWWLILPSWKWRHTRDHDFTISAHSAPDVSPANNSKDDGRLRKRPGLFSGVKSVIGVSWTDKSEGNGVTKKKWLSLKAQYDRSIFPRDLHPAANRGIRTGEEISKPNLKFNDIHGLELEISEDGSSLGCGEREGLIGPVWTDGNLSVGKFYWEMNFNLHHYPNTCCRCEIGVGPRDLQTLDPDNYNFIVIKYSYNTFCWRSRLDINTDYDRQISCQSPHSFRLGFYMDINTDNRSLAVLDCTSKTIIARGNFRQPLDNTFRPYVWFFNVKSASVEIIPPKHTTPLHVIRDILQL